MLIYEGGSNLQGRLGVGRWVKGVVTIRIAGLSVATQGAHEHLSDAGLPAKGALSWLVSKAGQREFSG